VLEPHPHRDLFVCARRLAPPIGSLEGKRSWRCAGSESGSHLALEATTGWCAPDDRRPPAMGRTIRKTRRQNALAIFLFTDGALTFTEAGTSDALFACGRGRGRPRAHTAVASM